MKKFYSFIVLLLSVVLLFGCGRDDAGSVPTESQQKTTSETSRVKKKIRQELLKSDFIFETDDKSKLAILSSPNNVTYTSVYGELTKDDDRFIILTGKVTESKNINAGENAVGMSQVKITKIHEIDKDKTAFKEGDNIYLFECYFEKNVGIDEKPTLSFAPTNDSLYHSPLLIEDEEYIFFLADKTRIDQRMINRVDLGEDKVWYNHAAFRLDYEYIEQYEDNISDTDLIKAFTEGKISKKSYYYQLHKDVLEKFNK